MGDNDGNSNKKSKFNVNVLFCRSCIFFSLNIRTGKKATGYSNHQSNIRIFGTALYSYLIFVYFLSLSFTETRTNQTWNLLCFGKTQNIKACVRTPCMDHGRILHAWTDFPVWQLWHLWQWYVIVIRVYQDCILLGQHLTHHKYLYGCLGSVCLIRLDVILCTKIQPATPFMFPSFVYSKLRMLVELHLTAWPLDLPHADDPRLNI